MKIERYNCALSTAGYAVKITPGACTSCSSGCSTSTSCCSASINTEKLN